MMTFKRRTPGDALFSAINAAILALLAVIMFYPFWHEVCISLSAATEATRGGIFILPRRFTVEAYQMVFKNAFVWTAYQNSLFTAAMVTLIGTLASAMLAYGLSKRNVAGSRSISFLVTFCMIFNGGLIPTYLVIKSLGLVDSLWAIILPVAVTPYNTIIMKNFFSSLPDELEEAAFIDGAGPLRIFFQIVLPLSKAVLATIALWLVVASWNNFQGPLIYINERIRYTLPLYVRQVIDGQMISRLTGEGAKAAVESVVGATIIVTILPVICVYPFLQKYFVKGVMIGSVKG